MTRAGTPPEPVAARLVGDYVRAGHDAQADRLSYRTLLRGRRLLRWSELRRVRYSPGMKWIRLETTDGAVARRMLQQTAEGHPPSVWS